MAGGRSEWERRQAALRREAERQARESAKVAKEQERERQRQRLERQQSTAERKTAEVAHRIEELDQVLLAALGVRPLSFDQMQVSSSVRPFVPEPPPDRLRAGPRLGRVPACPSIRTGQDLRG